MSNRWKSINSRVETVLYTCGLCHFLFLLFIYVSVKMSTGCFFARDSYKFIFPIFSEGLPHCFHCFVPATASNLCSLGCYYNAWLACNRASASWTLQWHVSLRTLVQVDHFLGRYSVWTFSKRFWILQMTWVYVLLLFAFRMARNDLLPLVMLARFQLGTVVFVLEHTHFK